MAPDGGNKRSLYLGDFHEYGGDEPYFRLRFVDPVPEKERASIVEALWDKVVADDGSYGMILENERWLDERTLSIGTNQSCWDETDDGEAMLCHLDRVIEQIHAEHPIFAVLLENGLKPRDLRLDNAGIAERFGAEADGRVPWSKRSRRR